MNNETQNQYTEKEIEIAWIEAGREKNGITIVWFIERLRKNKEEKDKKVEVKNPNL